jgi:hypothetical protein
VRRACWQALDGFDIEHFARGYGEECDFCRRAAKAGWSNVLAADVFVFHEGSISFGGEREALMAAGAAAMNRLHPEYHARVMDFLRADPARTLRDNLTRARGRRLLTDCDAVLGELIAERDARDLWVSQRLNERERELTALHDRTRELGDALANAERFVREREAEVARLAPRCTQLEAETVQMRAVLDELQARFDAIANSRTWRWSRRILRWLRLR